MRVWHGTGQGARCPKFKLNHYLSPALIGVSAISRSALTAIGVEITSPVIPWTTSPSDNVATTCLPLGRSNNEVLFFVVHWRYVQHSNGQAPTSTKTCGGAFGPSSL